MVGLLAGAVLLFAWAVTRPAPAAEGARPGPTGGELFARHCAMCHDPGDTARAFRGAADREAAEAALRAFLADHHGPSAEGTALIARYLLELDR